MTILPKDLEAIGFILCCDARRLFCLELLEFREHSTPEMGFHASQTFRRQHSVEYSMVALQRDHALAIWLDWCIAEAGRDDQRMLTIRRLMTCQGRDGEGAQLLRLLASPPSHQDMP